MVEEPVKALAEAAIEGAQAIVRKCGDELRRFLSLNENISRIDGGKFPVYTGLTGREVKRVSDLKAVFEYAKELLPQTKVRESLYLPYLGDALDAGMATIIASELIEFVSSVGGNKFRIDDATVKDIDSLLSRGKIRGLVAIIDRAPSPDRAMELISHLRQKKLSGFFIGVEGESIYSQVEDEIDFSRDKEHFLFDLGKEISGASLFLGLLVRMAFLKSKINPGEARKLLTFVKENFFAFQIVLGEITPIKAAYIAGAISFGVQTVGQVYIPQLLPIHSLP